MKLKILSLDLHVTGVRQFLTAPSMSTYSRLSEASKNSLRWLYFESFGEDYFLSSDGCLKNLTHAAYILLNSYPSERIYALGQTPAWLVFLASLLDSSPDRFSHIAFSGSWMAWVEDNLFIDDPAYSPSIYHTQSYRSYLTSLGLDPKTIISRYQTTGQRTVITDMVDTGEGLESIQDLYYNWISGLNINEAVLSECLIYVLLEDDSVTAYTVDNNMPYIEVESNLLVAMAESDSFNDRFVPHYPYKKWLDPPESIETFNFERKALIKFRLMDSLSAPHQDFRHFT